MKVAIIDDEPLARMELTYLLEQTNEVASIVQGESIEEAFQILLTDQPDLLFLDIHLTDESGIDIARKLTMVANPPLIIFATAYDNHALEAFEVNALDYILKPFEEERVRKAIAKAKDALMAKEIKVNGISHEKNVSRLTIETDERIYLVDFEDVYYCEVQGKETTIYTRKGTYTSHTTLAAIERTLSPEQFIKVHRSYIINLEAIKEIQPWFNQTYQITMANGGKVPVSRSYIKSFKQQVGL